MVKFSDQKKKHLKALSNAQGVIAAAAMDQRGSLKKSLAKEKGVADDQITDAMMSEFKAIVSKVLTPHASAILLDPEWGLPAAKARAKNAGLILSYVRPATTRAARAACRACCATGRCATTSPTARTR